MTPRRHPKEELRLRYGRLGVVGRPAWVLCALALLALLLAAGRCGGEGLAAIARCVWQVRPMDPEPLPGQKRPPCGDDAAPYGRGCYVLATHLDGSLYLPTGASCGDDFHGPWAWPTGSAPRCWARFFPRSKGAPAAETAIWNVAE